ncbi:MAG TPA: hypothetical protein VNX40_09670 [Mucilaginibacter sp.]|nr:hypothetical protein [Mucilaginibacter sp.]
MRQHRPQVKSIFLLNEKCATLGFMRNKKIWHYFSIIDYGTKLFNANKGLNIYKSGHGEWTERDDWMPVDQRSMRWKTNGLEYSLEISPKIDEDSNIASWTLQGTVWYENDSDVYLVSFSPAAGVQLDYIAANTVKLLNEAYDHIIKIKKDDIPYSNSFLAM